MSIFPSLPIDFGPYHVEESLGAGGMATVYRAFDQNRQEWVALKILHPNFAAQPAIVQRFQQEARIAQSLEHAHIVRVIDYGVIDTIPYIALEYISGGSLMDRLQQPTRITLQQAARLLSQVASGLDYAHRQGIIHRDVKPGNVLLDGQGRVALTDFGIARVLDATHLTSTGLMPGTPLFMSPEQARGQRDVDERTDVYALAVMGYLLATGQHPFTGGEALAILNQHLTVDPATPTSVNPLLPKALNKVLLKGLAKNREARYASAGELARDFAHAVGMAGQTTTLIRLDEASASPISPVSLWQSKRRKNYQAGYWIPVAMLALLVMFLVIRIIRDDDRPTITTITDGNNASPVYFPTVTHSPTVTVVSMFTRAPTVTSTFTPTLSGEDQGWTAGAATMPASPTYTASPQVRVYNTAGGVVRSGPGEWYPVIAEVGHKDSFRVVACSEANLTWYLIVLPWGEQGWISGADAVPSGGLAPAEIPTAATIPPTPDLTLTDIILPTPQIQVNSSVGGFVRSGPGVGYPVIGEVKAAESFAVLGYWAGDPVWYLIMLPWGEQGWISGAVAALSGDGGAAPIPTVATIPPTPSFTPTAIQTATRTPPEGANAYVSYGVSNLHLRNEASVNSGIITNLDELTVLILLGRTVDSTWFQVQTPNGHRGWVMAQYITITTNIEGLMVIVTNIPGPSCGNLICESGESSATCLNDCAPPVPPATDPYLLEPSYAGMWYNRDPLHDIILRIEVWFQNHAPYMRWWSICWEGECEKGIHAGVWQGENLYFAYYNEQTAEDYSFTLSLSESLLMAVMNPNYNRPNQYFHK